MTRRLLHRIREGDKVRDITLAIVTIGILALVAIGVAPTTETMTVLSYAVTAIGSLATGYKLK